MADWVWGETPAGFTRIGASGRRLVVARADMQGLFVEFDFFAATGAPSTTSRFEGRGSLRAQTLADGTAVVVRPYHRGGMVRHVTKDIFSSWPPRPFTELAATEQARRRGVLTVEPLAACVERIWGPFYRGWLVTRELTGAKDLWAALHEQSYTTPDKKALLRAVAASVRRMHRAGICHGDLNLKNILVRREGDEIRAYIIDFDKAELFSGAVPRRKSKRNLARLGRSARKLDPARRWLSAEELDWLDRLCSAGE
ncbi:MAG TPA: lipopolysaccharide kinase InaA family protein [Candidatus Acidoferrales bacterium]|nr:lipopolysaccharide kinase InaA family protein [Candidatus Acidoferrales bacterium]